MGIGLIAENDKGRLFAIDRSVSAFNHFTFSTNP